MDFVVSTATPTPYTTTLSGNSASSNGGGGYVADGNVYIRKGTSLYDNQAANQGGGLYVYDGTVEATDCIIGIEDHPNISLKAGGGLYMKAGDFTMNGSSISYNVGTTGGGGAYINGGTVTLNGGRVSHNRTNNNGAHGGGIRAGSDSGSGSITINTTRFEDNFANSCGGGIYVNGNSFTLSLDRYSSDSTYAYFSGNKATHGAGIWAKTSSVNVTGARFTHNEAVERGGAIYVNGGAFTLNGGEVDHNEAGTHGGGFYIDPDGASTTTIQNEASIHDNEAGNNGGGVYVAKGNVDIKSSTLSTNTAYNHGGALYSGGGNIDITDAEITRNTATNNNGGGVYTQGGIITIKGGNLSSNHAGSNGGFLCVAKGSSGSGTVNIQYHASATQQTPLFTGNSALNGGVIYMANGTCNLENGRMGGSYANRNIATQYGGAIYSGGGTLNFTDGTVSYNVAGESGGAFYVGVEGVLKLLSNVTLSKNHVPAGKKGGGVYLAGVVQIGGTPPGTLKTIVADDNFAYGDIDFDPTSYSPYVSEPYTNTRNNIYLDNPSVNPGRRSVLTIMENGIEPYVPGSKTDPSGSHIGFTTPRNFVPVVYCAYSGTSQAYLRSFLDQGLREGTIFEDSQNYYTAYYDAPYDPNHLYLWGTAWTQKITTWPPAASTGFSAEGLTIDDANHKITVSTPQAMAYTLSYINGLNGLTSHPDYDIILDADLDMGLYFWAPIGAKNAALADVVYTGTFNGKGHTIRNIFCFYVASLTNNGLGMFGLLGDGAKVKDLYVRDLEAVITVDPATASTPQYAGILAETATGNVEISGCIVDGNITTAHPLTIMGGLIGKTDGSGDAPSIHSSYAASAMSGFQMGGLVGQMNAGSILNCNAAPNFNPQSRVVVTMTDSGDGGLGNGWDGSKLTLSFNDDTPSIDLTMVAEDKASKTVYVSVTPGVLVTLSWTSASANDSECDIEVNLDNGTTYYSTATSGTPTSGTLASFTMPDFSYYIGGIAGVNAGTIENCYASEQTGSQHSNTQFGWLAGNNTDGRLYYSYAPEDASAAYTYTGMKGKQKGLGRYGLSTLPNGKYGFNHCDQQITLDTTGTNTYVVNGGLSHTGELHGLVATLNKWVTQHNSSKTTTYFPWTRTMGLINGDYPVFISKLDEDYVCIGSPDGYAVEYATNANTLIKKYNDSGTGIIYLYRTNPTALNASTGSDVRIAIGEHIGILQNGAIDNARVAITLDNSKADASLWGKPYDWHMFGTPLSNAPLGLTYNPNSVPYTPSFDNYPPQLRIDAGCYFPSDTPYGPPYYTAYGYPGTFPDDGFDFYDYHEPSGHWINLKRNSDDHWHQDDHTWSIDYTNESTLGVGKGYLLAVSKPTMLMAEGTLNNGDVTFTPSVQAFSGYPSLLFGFNLIANPYQSYLDFDKFVRNSGSWTSCPNEGKIVSNTYIILDADQGGYIGYTPGVSPGADVAPQFIHPHQGFFVKVTESAGTLKFTNGMRAVEGESDSYFRGDERPAYPLVNMKCTDSNGNNDFAVIELNRPEAGGGEKFKNLHAGTASIWFHYDDTDWYIAFTTPGINEAPLRFQAYEDGVFTLRWNPQNAEFSYLHLIDNLTGTDVDCLTADKYVFEGKTTDYASRFRLVFEFNEEEEMNESDTFAFMMGDELIVNGEGTLQMFDVNGRLLMEKTLYGAQNSTALPRLAPSVYVLRLTGNNQTKIQKLIIR